MASKESLDVVVFLETFADSVLKAKADQSIDWTDLRYLAPLASVGQAALENAKNIPLEFGDMSAEEIQEIATRIITASILLVSTLIK